MESYRDTGDRANFGGDGTAITRTLILQPVRAPAPPFFGEPGEPRRR